MIHEHDCIVLTVDLPAEGLAAGDIGTVVHVHNGGQGYEVEFITLDGQTIAVSTLPANQVRPIARREQVAAWKVRDDIETRAKRGNPADLDRILAKVPNRPPLPGDGV
jgi:hypothetical protein